MSKRENDQRKYDALTETMAGLITREDWTVNHIGGGYLQGKCGAYTLSGTRDGGFTVEHGPNFLMRSATLGSAVEFVEAILTPADVPVEDGPADGVAHGSSPDVVLPETASHDAEWKPEPKAAAKPKKKGKK